MIAIDLLEEVDREVREQLDYARDEPVQGWLDDWKPPDRSLHDGEGDCEDFMLLAARKLLDHGVSPEDLYLVTVNTEGRDRANHAVLMAATEDGLMTCGDTFVTWPARLIDAYPLPAPKEWMRLSDPGNWRIWKDG